MSKIKVDDLKPNVIPIEDSVTEKDLSLSEEQVKMGSLDNQTAIKYRKNLSAHILDRKELIVKVVPKENRTSMVVGKKVTLSSSNIEYFQNHGFEFELLK